MEWISKTNILKSIKTDRIDRLGNPAWKGTYLESY